MRHLPAQPMSHRNQRSPALCRWSSALPAHHLLLSDGTEVRRAVSLLECRVPPPSAWPHLPQRQSGAKHSDISFGITQALRGPRLLCAKSQPTAYLAAKLESTQMTELIIKPSTEPELIPLGCYWAFALLLFYGTPAKRMSIITQLRTHTFPAQGALCLLPSPKSLARRCSSLAAAVPAARSSVPGAGIGQAYAGRRSPAAPLLPAPLIHPSSLVSP